MISTEAEFQGAQRELQYLKDFLTQVEQSLDEPHSELTIIGIYKKMYHVWEELDEYYRARLAEFESVERDEERIDVTPLAAAESGVSPT